MSNTSCSWVDGDAPSSLILAARSKAHDREPGLTRAVRQSGGRRSCSAKARTARASGALDLQRHPSALSASETTVFSHV
ncbi:hypothetical protein F441_06792 [Phytophthora nicotianae CJ01A1]|uniref:Uncharacterized protein n=5 Tax=Phytophthora nicotianae TaxID=4792 RepID=V9FFS3_PHYNI|nr:hypothetical protein F443_06788 [Phytophthora nicotianae P1569]ETL42619.1 hypothetical protein L916_06599 [Phytophthora nicotianae]ETO78014.1 hypothetical protein F444_06858 [Phytophthora nicotianae P1976]ETP19087.1 hypothetical protein F441_06792 [Phytophthora nicotianae CJ01A1]ETP47032.1 hypothetical protein F442_06825 [Phytophthora nicotianae P10297]